MSQRITRRWDFKWSCPFGFSGVISWLVVSVLLYFLWRFLGWRKWVVISVASTSSGSLKFWVRPSKQVPAPQSGLCLSDYHSLDLDSFAQLKYELYLFNCILMRFFYKLFLCSEECHSFIDHVVYFIKSLSVLNLDISYSLWGLRSASCAPLLVCSVYDALRYDWSWSVHEWVIVSSPCPWGRLVHLVLPSSGLFFNFFNFFLILYCVNSVCGRGMGWWMPLLLPSTWCPFIMVLSVRCWALA